MSKIKCSRCQQKKEQMERSPYPGPLADKILENVCEDCWKEWIEASLIMLNEYRLNLLDPKHAEMYDQQLQIFLGLMDPGEAPQLNLKPPEPPKN
jgi:Fe-S cluster biosynthesis and repair protein YggX